MNLGLPLRIYVLNVKKRDVSQRENVARGWREKNVKILRVKGVEFEDGVAVVGLVGLKAAGCVIKLA